MAVYESCGSCNGARALKCSDCPCRQCKGGRVDTTCPKCCGSAKITCQRCEGTGQVLKKKGWFSDTYDECWKCSGSRQEACSCNQGKLSIACPSCKGLGRNAQCLKCGATGQLMCSTCKGSGRVRSEWYRSLSQMPVDRLKFEHQKRQQRISVLEMKQMGLQRQYDSIQEMWAEETSHLHTAQDWHN